MRYNCSYCKTYWDFLKTPYYSDLLSRSEEATKDVTLFCPACQMSKVRKDRWTKKHESI